MKPSQAKQTLEVVQDTLREANLNHHDLVAEINELACHCERNVPPSITERRLAKLLAFACTQRQATKAMWENIFSMTEFLKGKENVVDDNVQTISIGKSKKKKAKTTRRRE